MSTEVGVVVGEVVVVVHVAGVVVVVGVVHVVVSVVVAVAGEEEEDEEDEENDLGGSISGSCSLFVVFIVDDVCSNDTNATPHMVSVRPRKRNKVTGSFKPMKPISAAKNGFVTSTTITRRAPIIAID